MSQIVHKRKSNRVAIVAHTICGGEYRYSRTTNQWNRTTCKLCLRRFKGMIL